MNRASPRWYALRTRALCIASVQQQIQSVPTVARHAFLDAWSGAVRGNGGFSIFAAAYFGATLPRLDIEE